ncbi:Ndr1-like [Thalictrum thalictroides]|uniref:Ndr1-like n=1 Tax=Thalictrum thalictroides TaxID=46969 RepID=A0A7J6WD33_THATH|nr:Ndr1-like [Thalictrum thalictroides]
MGKGSKPHIDIYLWLLQIIIVLALASLVIIWVCLHPKTPTYTILDFYIPALDDSNNSTVNRNSTIIFNLQISNPNKGIGIYYDQANVSIQQAGNQDIGGSFIPCFYQGHKKSTRREVTVNALEQFWKTDLNSTLVDLILRLKTEVRYTILGRKTKHHMVNLEGHVSIGSDGKLVEIILWLSLRPQSPTYTITDFSIPSLDNQNQNTTSSVISNNSNSTVSLVLKIKNPNKDYSIYFDDINMKLYHGSDALGVTTIKAYKQDKKENENFPRTIDADGPLRNVLREILKNGTTELRVGLDTKIRFKIWGRKTKHHGVQLDGRVPIGKDGKISGKNKGIKLHKRSKK